MAFLTIPQRIEMLFPVFWTRFDKYSTTCTFSHVTGSGYGGGEGIWNVTLTRNRADSDLTVSTLWTRTQPTHQTFLPFKSMYIVPRSNFFHVIAMVPLAWSAGTCTQSAKVLVPAHTVLKDDRYDFDIVFSTDHELTRNSATVPSSVPVPASTPIPTPTSMLKERNLASLLLKDPNSVDVCFRFPSHKTIANIGLWAHSFLLSQNVTFAKLIQNARMIQSLVCMGLAKKDSDGNDENDSDTGSNTESFSDFSVRSTNTVTGPAISSVAADSRAPLVIKVDDVSLATFCVMLYYIYTHKIDLAVDTSRFVLSDTNKADLLWRDDTGKVENSAKWRPLDQDSPWRLKDVTWKELKDAAAQYGLEGLQALAEQGLQSHK
ncbi:MAG: hypothetical protein J3R72DRAFT_448465 [Linnemannia gamsii]|nr:MAG: hypothetical protein J3R72DRAFT_448465 [Linnemannia gamsii]